MSALTFIVDRAGTDHFSKLMNILKQDYQGDPDGYYFYLVPNHIKFKSEINTLGYLRTGNRPYAQSHIQILSLTRMGWFFFNRHMMQQHQQISDSGVNMLLYALIEENADKLPLFKREIDHIKHGVGQTGFILKIAQAISEMQTSQISAADLKTLYDYSIKGDSRHDDLVRKMHDFLIIYKAYEKATNNKYISKSGVLERLCKYLADLPKGKLQSYHFYISGFSQFTAQENRLVQILIEKSAKVVIDLDMDQACLNNPKVRPFDLFYRPWRLYHQMYSFAKGIKAKVITESVSSKTHPRLRVSPDLSRLENYWIDAYQKHLTPREFKGSLKHSDSVQVIQADNTYSELASVAVRIRQMITAHPDKYRYSDFLILTRHLDKFSNVIQPIFHLQQIPIFNDLQNQMVLHPLVRLISDLFSIYHSDSERKYTYRDVMDLLKTGLLRPKDDQGNFMNADDYYRDLYLCENCVLQNGYWGDEWLDKKPWQYSHYNDFAQQTDVNRIASQRINVIKKFVRTALTSFYDQLDQAKTCRDAATALYRFLVDNGVVAQLKQWRREEIQNHQLASAGQNNQVWTVFCQLLDSCVDILGDKRFNADFTINDFWSLLKAGFESASYSQVPPTFDQVVISESKIVQMRNYKVVFMIGSTDDVMPDHTPNDTLLSNTDRADLKPSIEAFDQKTGKQCYLNDGSEYQVNNEPYLNYLAFMSATQKVIFTYSLKSDTENKGNINESPYIVHMQEAFGIPTQHPDMMPAVTSIGAGLYSIGSVRPYLGSPLGTLHHLIQALHAIDDLARHHQKDSISLPKNWQYIEDLLLDKTSKDNQIESDAFHVDIPALTNKLMASVHYKNEPVQLKPKLVKLLYGRNLDISISQLQTFYRNPYEYFLKYGLDLKPRQILGSSALSDFGQFYHAALKHLLILINNNHGTRYDELSKSELNDDVDTVVSHLINGPKALKYEILNSSSRMGYIKSRLKATVRAMAYTIYLQATRYSKLKPRYMELPFKVHRRRESWLDPLSFTVRAKRGGSKHHVKVDGQIDRVDRLTDLKNHRQYYGIVDYKSSPHSFDYGQIFSGLQMQMITYLDALYKNIQDRNHLVSSDDFKSYVFGAVYSLIQDPVLQLKNYQDYNKVKHYQTAPWDLLLQQQKYNGILIDDIGLPAKLIDKNLDPKQHGIPSMMYKTLKRKGNGHYTKPSTNYLITADEFNVIRKWVEFRIKRAAKLIYSGYDDLKPAQWGNDRSALTYSPYKSIMCFDPLLTSNRYNKIKPINSPGDLVDAIKQAEDGKDK